MKVKSPEINQQALRYQGSPCSLCPLHVAPDCLQPCQPSPASQAPASDFLLAEPALWSLIWSLLCLHCTFPASSKACPSSRAYRRGIVTSLAQFSIPHTRHQMPVLCKDFAAMCPNSKSPTPLGKVLATAVAPKTHSVLFPSHRCPWLRPPHPHTHTRLGKPNLTCHPSCFLQRPGTSHARGAHLTLHLGICCPQSVSILMPMIAKFRFHSPDSAGSWTFYLVAF